MKRTDAEDQLFEACSTGDVDGAVRALDAMTEPREEELQEAEAFAATLTPKGRRIVTNLVDQIRVLMCKKERR